MLDIGKKFKIKVAGNPLIHTTVGNVVKVVTSNESSTEFMDQSTYDWLILQNKDIKKYLEEI